MSSHLDARRRRWMLSMLGGATRVLLTMLLHPLTRRAGSRENCSDA